ncbi:hypothetical protein LANSK_13460 [Lactobacillus amylovorus subsp. amylovorus]
MTSGTITFHGLTDTKESPLIIINVGKNENLTSLSSAANMDLYYGNEKIDWSIVKLS